MLHYQTWQKACFYDYRSAKIAAWLFESFTPMNYWILALPRVDMEHCIKVGVFGLKRKNQLDKMKSGDKLVLLATKEAKVLGFGEVTKEYYIDDAKVFLAQTQREVFPDRIGFKATALGKAEEIDFKELIYDLSFIKTPLYWGAHLISGVCKIPEKDYDLIVEAPKAN